MEFKLINYTADSEKKFTKTETVEEITGPQIDRMQQMAEAQPGRIVMGISYKKDDKLEHESERYLDI